MTQYSRVGARRQEARDDIPAELPYLCELHSPPNGRSRTRLILPLAYVRVLADMPYTASLVTAEYRLAAFLRDVPGARALLWLAPTRAAVEVLALYERGAL